MTIAVLSDEDSYKEISVSCDNLNWTRINELADLEQDNKFDILFCLTDGAGLMDFSKLAIPVFVNSVCHTLHANNHGVHVVRFNGWKGFMERKVWEVSGKLSDVHKAVLDRMGKKIIVLPDESGFVSARIISMIVNEACFAKNEEVSTEDEINTAMKLGTNYPNGPFEWKNKIGIKNIYELLKALTLTDSKYKPSLLLEKEALKA